jgi:quinol monooxygenase YgiN
VPSRLIFGFKFLSLKGFWQKSLKMKVSLSLIMINMIVKYEVKNKNIAKAKILISKFTSQVKKKESGTLNYSVFKEDDKNSFIHIISFKDEKAQKKHGESKWVREFIKSLYPLCSKEPVFNTLEHVNDKVTVPKEKEVKKEDKIEPKDLVTPDKVFL